MKIVRCLFFGFLLGVLLTAGAIRAQNPTLSPGYFTYAASISHSNCVVPAAGTTAYCFAGDGAWVSVNGAAFVQFAPAAGVAAPALTINGTTKTLPATFTISAAAPTTSAPAIAAN